MKDPNPHGHPATGPQRADDRNISAKWIGLAGLILAGLMLATFVIAFVSFVLMAFIQRKTEPPHSPLAEEKIIPPEPRLQATPRADLEVIRAEEHRLVTTYGWVNKQAGIVRIPVERAMELTLLQGFPARKQEKTS